ncbi:uncharacterized protein [Drosophila virilis]|uniref:Uncharacterized protein n=1 Tax=Drosophila virilis TaxID=7244 RepID=A0A0Q9WFC3_DROVI|nr:uncharacterized protein LOC26530705 [Drosophila virilis]KRF82946.1 uncharacterized protein Dvir_GJ25935 [Drosophila virilis]
MSFMKIESENIWILGCFLTLNMAQIMSYGKLKILFINIIAILYKATALNVHRLHSDLRETKVLVNSAKQEVWIRELFIFLISGLVLMRFLMCFLGLASNIVAIYPILTNSQPELLMPTIIVQVLDSVVLHIYEIVLGYSCLKYLYSQSFAVFAIFLAKMAIKATCCITVLNIYSEKHHQMTTNVAYTENGANLERDSSEEFEIAHQHFRPIG